jgi:hypothetical protein
MEVSGAARLVAMLPWRLLTKPVAAARHPVIIRQQYS